MLVNKINTINKIYINFFYIKYIYNSLFWYHKTKYLNYSFKKIKRQSTISHNIYFFNKNLVFYKKLNIYYSNKVIIKFFFLYNTFVKSNFFINYYFFFINSFFFFWYLNCIRFLQFSNKYNKNLLLI